MTSAVSQPWSDAGIPRVVGCGIYQVGRCTPWWVGSTPSCYPGGIPLPLPGWYPSPATRVVSSPAYHGGYTSCIPWWVHLLHTSGCTVGIPQGVLPAYLRVYCPSVYLRVYCPSVYLRVYLRVGYTSGYTLGWAIPQGVLFPLSLCAIPALPVCYSRSPLGLSLVYLGFKLCFSPFVHRLCTVLSSVSHRLCPFSTRF